MVSIMQRIIYPHLAQRNDWGGECHCSEEYFFVQPADTREADPRLAILSVDWNQSVKIATSLCGKISIKSGKLL